MHAHNKPFVLVIDKSNEKYQQPVNSFYIGVRGVLVIKYFQSLTSCKLFQKPDQLTSFTLPENNLLDCLLSVVAPGDRQCFADEISRVLRRRSWEASFSHEQFVSRFSDKWRCVAESVALEEDHFQQLYQDLVGIRRQLLWSRHLVKRSFVCEYVAQDYHECSVRDCVYGGVISPGEVYCKEFRIISSGNTRLCKYHADDCDGSADHEDDVEDSLGNDGDMSVSEKYSNVA